MMMADTLQDQIDKTFSVVETARRLLLTGTMVDLAALEGKVRQLCDDVLAADRQHGRTLIPLMERLIHELDKLDRAIRDRREAGL